MCRGTVKAFVLALAGFAILAILSPANVSASPVDDRVSAWTRNIAEARNVAVNLNEDDAAERIAALEAIRARIAEQREAALAASRSQPFEVTILQGKLRLLGAVPEGGETDFAASRRNALETELYEAEAPRRAYEDAYLRSAATVAELDEQINQLQFSKLVQRAPSPLWPSAWVAFANQSSQKASAYFVSNAGSDASDNDGPNSLYLSAALIVALVGILVATLGRGAVVARVNRSIESADNKRRVAWLAVAKDLSGFVLVLLGIAVIAAGSLIASIIYGGVDWPLAVLIFGLPLLLSHWFAKTVFSPGSPKLQMVKLDAGGAQKAVWLGTLIGFALGFESVVEAIEDSSPYSNGAQSIAPFFAITLVATALFLLGRALERSRPFEQEPEGDAVPDNDDLFVSQRIDWPRLAAKAMKASAVVAFVTGVVGYVALARWIIFPLIETLAVVAILAVIYLRLNALLSVVAERQYEEQAHNVLPAIRFGLILLFALAATPLIAYFWGIRTAELGDLLVLLRDGVTIGGSTISLGTVAVFFGVFILGYILTRWVQRLLNTAFLNRMEMDQGTRSAIITATGYVGIMLAFVAAVGAAGIDLSNLALVFGALSVGIGFGLQSIVANFVSGIIMLIERPIKEGDSIVVNGYAGIVAKISVRATRIQSFDHDDVIIPNSELISGTVRNRTLTDRMTRIECAVGIAYDADINAAFDIINEIARNHERTVEDPAPFVMLEQLGDSALMLRLYCFIDEVGKAGTTKSEMYVQIVRKFAEHGISIPYPQQEITLKGTQTDT